MNWADERYVRFFTRDTPDWIALTWQGRAVFSELLRKCDRSGIVEVRAGPLATRIRLIAGLTRIPVEVVEVGLADLLADGCLVEHALGYCLRNFIEAQNARSSDKLRAAEARDRRRSSPAASSSPALQNVTQRDAASRHVTESHQASPGVTERHTASLCAVPSPAVLSCAVPSPTQPKEALSGLSDPPRAPQPLTLDLQTPPAPDPVEQLRTKWNAIAVPAGLSEWKLTNDARRKTVKVRLEAHPLPEWDGILRKVAASDFLCGKVKPWKATIDWVLNPTNLVKVIEGNFENHKAPGIPHGRDPTDHRQQAFAEDNDHSAIVDTEYDESITRKAGDLS